MVNLVGSQGVFRRGALPLRILPTLTATQRLRKALFALAEPGVWYDPSDLTTLFQDTAGTTPVTAPGQTVARVNDKSGRGNHATQSILASRPTYAVVPATGRRNLLLATDTLATQSRTVTAVAHTLSFTGTGTVTLSGASTAGPLIGTGASNRVSLTFTPTAASLTLTVSGSVTLAQLELGSTATNYQRVGNAFDVTEAGVQSLSYLSFDGIDDFLVTPTITPGVDKAQVFAGVRKLSDAAAGMVAELSVSASTNEGTFQLRAPNTASATYGFGSRGSAALLGPFASGFAAPTTNVITGLGDISGDNQVLRIDGTQAAQSTADQGTGNYLAYPLYIGRRGGTEFPFNGHIYSLIVRFGANLDAATITSTESWTAGKTKVAYTEATWDNTADTYTQSEVFV
jgi:hypothetical protein